MANTPRRRRSGSRLIELKKRIQLLFRIIAGEAGLIVFFFVLFLFFSFTGKQKTVTVAEEAPVAAKEAPEPTLLEEKAAAFDFTPTSTANTVPSKMIASTDVMVGETLLSSPSEYSSPDVIDFGMGYDYTDMEGVITFRGNNFRDEPTYGFANMKLNKFKTVWEQQTDGLSYGNATWTGSGWTGQPLIVKWPKETKAIMNMNDWAKNDDSVVEVIYACMDGYIYFNDLWTGKETREKMYLGFTFKGAGALDPRGYPILYVGSGYNSNNGTSRAFIISLIDCTVMTEFGCEDPFSLRGSLSFFDSSALVDAETDTLIYPGESGILYIVKLNTNYNPTAGTLSINPSYTRWRYQGHRSNDETYWLGMEDSAVIYKGYLFITDNGGHFMCLDLNTLQLVWTQDTLDDSNGTPVLSVEDGHPYIYISTSFHLGWRSYDTAEIPIWKLDAVNGEIVWQTNYTCFTEDGVSGGVRSTVALGKNELKDYVYCTVSRTGEQYDGVLTCLEKSTGRIVWEHKAYYAWSSPVCVYNEDGTGKVIYATAAGKMYMLNGHTGEVVDEIVLSEGCIEASPAVYENMLVIGIRDCKIFGIELT